MRECLPAAQNNLGLAYSRIGANELAVRAWQEAIRLQPDYVTVFGKAAGKMGGIFGDAWENWSGFREKKGPLLQNEPKLLLILKKGRYFCLWKSGTWLYKGHDRTLIGFFWSLRGPQVLLITQDPQGTEKHPLKTLEADQFEVRPHFGNIGHSRGHINKV